MTRQGLDRGMSWFAGAMSALAVIMTVALLAIGLLPLQPIWMELDGDKLGAVCGDAYGGCVTRVGGYALLTAAIAITAGLLGVHAARRSDSRWFFGAGVAASLLWIPYFWASVHPRGVAPSTWSWGRAPDLAWVIVSLYFAAVLFAAGTFTRRARALDTL